MTPSTSESRPSPSCDVTIIGAGPAGVMAAAVLDKAGHSTQIFEASRFPRFVIGESLLPRCMDLLDEVGLLEAVKAQGYMVKNGAVFIRGEQRCTFDFSDQFASGWKYTWQVPRADFDQVLANAARERGIPVHFEHSVVDVHTGASPSVVVRDATGARTTVTSKFIVDASGYGRVIPRLLGLDLPSTLPARRSVFTHVRGDRRPSGSEEGRIWIVMNHDDLWTWVIPFSNGTTSVGVVGSPAFLARHGETADQILRSVLAETPTTAERLRDAEFLFEARSIDGYSIGIKQLHGPNYCLVGNTTEFLDPVFSSGVTLALESANRAAKVAARQLAGEEVDWDRDYADYLMGGVDCFRTYVEGWYAGTLPKVFFAPNPAPEVKKMVCSVLSGYVWDRENPFVRDHANKLAQLALVIGA